MKYKNTTKNILKFRAIHPKGEKMVFEIKPGQTIETQDKMELKGMELINSLPEVEGMIIIEGMKVKISRGWKQFQN